MYIFQVGPDTKFSLANPPHLTLFRNLPTTYPFTLVYSFHFYRKQHLAQFHWATPWTTGCSCVSPNDILPLGHQAALNKDEDYVIL